MDTTRNGHNQTLNRVRRLLDTGRPEEARDLLLGMGSRPPELQNALGVCWMRLGETDKAIELYRGMVLLDRGVSFRPDASEPALVNFATALLLIGNVAGCEAALNARDNLNGEGAARLRGAIDRWRHSLGPFRRFIMALNGAPYDARVPLDFTPGEV